MPLFTDALLGDTLHLSIEAFGAYTMLLIVTWRNNGEALADDDDALARICRVTKRRWRDSLRPVIIRFFDIADGRLHQKRLEKEWQFCTNRAAISRVNGARGGRPKQLKSRQTGNPAGYFTETQGESPLNHKPLTIEESPPIEPPKPARNGHDRSGERGSRLQVDWEPSAEDRQFAEARGLNVEAAADEFRDHWLAVPGNRGRKLDWSRTFKNRCRQLAEPHRSHAGNGRSGASSVLTALRAIRLPGEEPDVE